MAKATTQNETIEKITPNEFVNIAGPLYAAGVTQETVMLWGPPGVGKSEVISGTLAKYLESQTGKKVIFTDVRLLLFNPVDLRGIPVPQEKVRDIPVEMFNEKVQEIVELDEKKDAALIQQLEDKNMMRIKEGFTKWLKPQIFNLNASPDVINILLLDEISAAPPAVQAAAFQLTLDRKIGEHDLPTNTIIIAAGNRVVDKGVAYKMPTPLANRMTHFEIYADIDDWKEWAIPNEVHPLVIGFLNFQNGKLHDFDPSRDDLAFPTPRAWSKVSKFLYAYKSVSQAIPMIAGTIGVGTAAEFKEFADTYGKLPNIQDIFDGKPVDVPSRNDIQFALSAAIVSRVGKAETEQLKNVVKFTLKLQKEFAILTMKDMLKVDGVKTRIMTSKEWLAWSKENKALIVG